MRIEIDELSGFCFGVVRAISHAEEALERGEQVRSLGDIVHNGMEVSRLEALGLESISHEQLPSLRGESVLIRAHGEPPATYALAHSLSLPLIDATCPVVARLQRLVVQAAEQMRSVGGEVVILGKRGHAEVVGLTGQVDHPIVVVERMEDLEQIDFTRPIFLLSQTTQSLELFEEVRAEILRRATDPAQVIVRDTICRQVSNRNPHLRTFARQFDVIIFVAGRKSSNGQVLYASCQASNPRSYLIEGAAELDPAWFEGVASVGICGATSTPKWLMQQVATRIEELCSL